MVSLLLWLGPHIAKHSNQSSALQIVECAMPITTMVDEDSSQTMLEDGIDPYTGGATT